jgi:hypothetical protein
MNTIKLYPSDVPSHCDASEYPWNQIPADGRTFEIIVDSSVNGGGVRLRAISELVIGTCVEDILGSSHPTIVQGRRLTEDAIHAQQTEGRRLATIARDERRLGKF